MNNQLERDLLAYDCGQFDHLKERQMKHVGTIGDRVIDNKGQKGTIKNYAECVGFMMIQFDGETTQTEVKTSELHKITHNESKKRK